MNSEHNQGGNSEHGHQSVRGSNRLRILEQEGSEHANFRGELNYVAESPKAEHLQGKNGYKSAYKGSIKGENSRVSDPVQTV